MIILVPIARKTHDLGWTQTCTPAFYTYTLSNTSVINQSCTSPSLLFLRAETPSSYYQSLLPVSVPVSITVRDTSYGLTEWDSSQLVRVSLLQVACEGEDVSALYWNQVVQFLFCKFHLCVTQSYLPTLQGSLVYPGK